MINLRAGDHSLAQGLKGDATYLVVNDKGALENYGINGVPAPWRRWRSGACTCTLTGFTRLACG